MRWIWSWYLPTGSHGSPLGTNTQPTAGSHRSLVQPFPSRQVTGSPTQYPPGAQCVFWVHASPSSHVGGVPGMQPVPASQASVPLHALPSSQPLWTHVPAVHVSVVQGLPSPQSSGVPA